MKKQLKKLSLNKVTIVQLSKKEKNRVQTGVLPATRPFISCKVYCGPPQDTSLC